MSIVLKRGMLLSDRLYKPGDVIPDTEEARDLVKRGDAEVIEPPAASQPQAKPAKSKPAPEKEVKKPDSKGSENADGTGNP